MRTTLICMAALAAVLMAGHASAGGVWGQDPT